MDSLNVLRASGRVVAIDILVCRHIDGLAPVNDLAEFRRELRVCSVATCPEGVTAKRGDGVVV